MLLIVILPLKLIYADIDLVVVDAYFFTFSADIYEKIQEELESIGMETECLGGGRILHDTAQQTINVFGYSQVGDSLIAIFCVHLYAV